MKSSFDCYVPVYCSRSFSWRGNSGSCNSSDLITVYKESARLLFGTKHIVDAENSIYKGIMINSKKTGKCKYFEPVHDEDGYDGEFMIYRCDQFFIQIWNY